MRYFTREWYESIQEDAMIFDVRGDRRAAAFSEAFFQSLYDQKQREWLASAQERAMEIFGEEWPEEFQASPAMYRRPKAFKKARQVYLRVRNKVLKGIQRDVNEAALKADFADWYQRELDQIEENYPREILDGVADVRVLALGVVSPEVKKQIDRFVQELEERNQEPHRSYARHRTELLEKYPGSFIEEFGFHDAVLERLEQSGQELVLDLMRNYEDAERVRLRFSDCEIVRMDEGLEGADWLYEEIYEGESDGWEIHVLFFDCDACEDDPLRELILRASDVVIE